MSDFDWNKKGENWESPKKGGDELTDVTIGDIISFGKKGSNELV